jgi:hypothetical protein
MVLSFGDAAWDIAMVPSTDAATASATMIIRLYMMYIGFRPYVGLYGIPW